MQVLSQGVEKNAVGCRNSCQNVGISNRSKKIPNMGTHAGAHKVTMCNNSRHIVKEIGDQVHNVNKKQLMGTYQKRHSTCFGVYDTDDFSVLITNRFDSLTVEPSLEERCHMTDGGLVVTQTQKGDGTKVGLNLSHNNSRGPRWQSGNTLASHL